MTAQPQLTVAQVQAQREELTARLRAVQGRHAEVAYLNATQPGYEEQEAQIGGQVRSLEAALAHLATVQVGALQAAEAARDAARKADRVRLRGDADAAATQAMASAGEIDQANVALTTAWDKFKGQFAGHADAVIHLTEGDRARDGVMAASDRERQMLMAISARLGRAGLILPDGGDHLGPDQGGKLFAVTTEDMLVHVRRSARIGTDFPGKREEQPAAKSAPEHTYMGGIPHDMAMGMAAFASPPGAARLVATQVPSSPVPDRYAEL